MPESVSSIEQSLDKKKVLQALTARITTGISFIQTNYLDRYDNPDLAWIRNIYILLSFYTELLLKGLYVEKTDFRDSSELDAVLRKQGHDLARIAKDIGEKKLKEYNIEFVVKRDKEYAIKACNHFFTVKDFSDIRYDFIENKTRMLTGGEHNEFRDQIEAILSINKKLMVIAWG